MAFKPGNNANPEGAGAKKNQQKRLIKDLFSPHVKDAVKEVIAQLKEEEPKDRQWATEMVINYAFGKPSQYVEVSGEDGGPLVAVIREVIKGK